MRRVTFVVLILCGLFRTAYAEQPTAKQCRVDLVSWVSMFKAAYADPACAGDGTPSCAFVAPIRDLRTKQFSDLAFQAEACTKVDHKNRYLYQRVEARAENIVVMRAGHFIQETGQSEDYNEWEQSRMNPQPPPKEEDQYSLVDHAKDVRILALRKMHSARSRPFNIALF
jgi:hypothetical protein